MIEGKKASIILILKVLEEYSDEEHFLKQQDIIDKVYELYQVELERKSVASSIKLLQELDCDINFVPKAGYALFSRKFDDAEVRFITDALMTSKSIDGNKAIKLSSKLNSCLSTYQRKGYGQIYKCNSFNRSNNKEIFLNLEVINEAKKKGKQISFQYLGYDSDAKLVKKKGGFRYRVSPYYSVYNNQFYYLLCNYSPKYRPINIFRLDNMVNIQVEEDYDLIPLNQFKGYENFDISTFVNDNVYALLGEVITATIELDSSNSIYIIYDWFGKNAEIYKENGKLYAKIRSNENSLFFWCMSYTELMVIKSPQSLIDRIKGECSKILENYK